MILFDLKSPKRNGIILLALPCPFLKGASVSEKRRDSKGRILRTGESQRADGKYEYKYVDAKGVRRSLYSWRLVPSDKVPPKKYDCEALRDMEAKVVRDTQDGINSFVAARLTLNDFWEDYISTKYELKASTRTNYKYMYDKYVRGSIGVRDIASVRYSDVKRFYGELLQHGFKPNSVEIIQTILHPVFNVAVKDGYIRINPTDGVIAELKKSNEWEKPKRHALTVPEQESFVDFVTSSKTYSHWSNLFTVLLGTGMRIGECLGLRWEDCDFKSKIINVNHNLIYRTTEDRKMELHITTPKTKAGVRIIPMFDDVKRALLAERLRQMEHGFTLTEIDGYSGFIFQNRNQEVLNPHVVNRAIYRIIRDHNIQAKEKGATQLPHFSVHNLRHTFCTRLCENEPNIKIIQEIMGHRNIETTMDVYNEATKEKKIESFANLEGKIKIS